MANESAQSFSPKISKASIIFIVLSFVIGGGAGFLGTKFYHSQAPVADEKDFLKIAFLVLPDLVINLKSSTGRGNILKATFVIELSTIQDKEKIEHIKPLIADRFQTYLRELELSDIQGSAGIERVRQELFSRANAIASPIQIRNVLIKEFIIQ